MKKYTKLLILAILFAIVLGAVSSASNGVPQYADGFGAPGKVYTIPVYVEDTYTPINAIFFTVTYDGRNIKLIGVENGNLTPTWDEPVFYCPQKGTCNVAMVYDGTNTIPANSTGDICILKFRTVGGRTLNLTELSFSNIQLSDTNYVVGTALGVSGNISAIPDLEEYNGYWN